MSNVQTEHPDRLAFAPLWRAARAMVAGQRAVHAEGETFLPRLPDQTDDEYAAYKARANLYNAAERTVGGLLGLVERKEPIIEQGALPDEVLEAVSTSGQDVAAFATHALGETLITGGGGALVDFPPDDGAITLAEAERRNRRPTWTFYPVEDIINWRTAVVGNRERLVLLVLRECVDELEGDDEFSHDIEHRYRVLRLREGVYTQQLYDSEGAIGEELVPRVSGQTWREIPFVHFRPRPGEDMLHKAPIQDLVDLNIAHYQVRADYRHGLHHVALPTPYITGVRMDELLGADLADKVRAGDAAAIAQARRLYRWGPDALWIIGHENASVGMLEFSGAGLGELASDQQRIEWQMASQGARMLAPEEAATPQTATAENIRSHAEHATLVTVAQTNAMGISQLMEFTAAWLALSAENIGFEHNTDFAPGHMDPQRATVLMQMLQGSAMSREIFHWNLQRGEMMPGERTVEEEVEAIESERADNPPPPPAIDDEEPEDEDEGDEEGEEAAEQEAAA